MYVNDVKDFEVCGFKEEMHFSYSITRLAYIQDNIVVKKISSKGNRESLMFLKYI